MKYNQLGKTNILISELGFGAWGIGGATPGNTSYGATSDFVSLAALERAKDLGINFYDTSNVYGNGHSEALIGQAFSANRDKVVIATKCGMTDLLGGQDFRVASIENSLKSSLGRLKTEYVDLLQLHNPTKDLANNSELIDHLIGLREKGTVRALGVSVKNPSDILDFISGPWDCVQANFNLIDMRLLDLDAISLCKKNQISLIARTPLAFGFLSGKFDEKKINFTSGDHRLNWPKNQLVLWANAYKKFQEVISKPRLPVDLAFKFILAHKGIDSVLSGMASEQEVSENICSLSSPDLSEDELTKLYEVYRKNNFFIREENNAKD